MLTSFVSKLGSRERLKLRVRCGCNWCACQMRCTERSEMPTTFAMARAPSSALSHPTVGRRSTLRLVPLPPSQPQWGLARAAGLVAQQPVHPLLGKALLPAPDHRSADAKLMGDLLHRTSVGGGKHDVGSLTMIVRAVTIRDDP